MFGRVTCIAIGLYAGILIKQRYRMPELMSPGEMMARMREYENNQRQEGYRYRPRRGCCHRGDYERGPYWGEYERGPHRGDFERGPQRGDFERGPQMWEEIKKFEQSHRKDQPAPPAQPTPPTQAAPAPPTPAPEPNVA